MSSDRKWYPPGLRPDFVTRPPELLFSDEPVNLAPEHEEQLMGSIENGRPSRSDTASATQLMRARTPTASSSYGVPSDGPLRAPTIVIGEPRKTRRKRPRLSFRGAVPVLAVALFVGMVGAGVVAVRQNSTAGQWRRLDESAVSSNRLLSRNLLSANQAVTTADASIRSLNSHVTRLNGQIGGLQNQLSAVANAKEKALDQNALLTRLTNAAGVVSNNLSACVSDMDSLLNEIDTDLASLSYNDPNLQSNANIASENCSTAQQENEKLQAILSGVG
jgi:hypothetical protein